MKYRKVFANSKKGIIFEEINIPVMNKIIFLNAILILFSNYTFAQNFNKEKDHLIAMSNDKSKHVFIDFLKEFGIDQEIGLGDNIAAYNEYKKKVKLDKEGNIKLKKNPFFTSMEYEKNKYGIIESIRLNFKGDMYQPIKDKLISLFGKSESSNAGTFYIPHKYYILLRTYSNMSYLRINAVDFMTNYTKYDEFEDAGMTYFDESPVCYLDNSARNYIDFAYVYGKKNYKKFAIKNTYSGKDWLFINKIQFLLDDGKILNLDVEPERKVETFARINTCKEISLSIVSLEFINKILESKKVKVKISSDKGHFVFELSPLHKYQILTAKEYYDNYIIPEIEKI